MESLYYHASRYVLAYGDFIKGTVLLNDPRQYPMHTSLIQEMGEAHEDLSRHSFLNEQIFSWIRLPLFHYTQNES